MAKKVECPVSLLRGIQLYRGGKMEQELKNKKIAVIGIGGVGGYLGGMLANAYPHVTFAARGERAKAIREKGLMLHSDLSGEFIVTPEKVKPIEELEVQNIIFVCVKNYSLEEVCQKIGGAVSDETIIIPVMNGIDPGERTQKILGKGIVLDSLIYIIAFADTDYSIRQQGKIMNLKIGTKNTHPDWQQAVRDVSDILTGAKINHEAAEDIETEIWRKYILNCAYNVATSYYDNTIGQLRNDPKKAEEYVELVNEAFAVARKKGIKVTQEQMDKIIYQFYHELADDATSSLQRDISTGKKSELETFSGYIVREAKKLGMVIPVSEKMYEGLKSRTIKLR